MSPKENIKDLEGSTKVTLIAQDNMVVLDQVNALYKPCYLNWTRQRLEDTIFKNEGEQYQLVIGSLKLKHLERFKEKDRFLKRSITWKSIAVAILVICGTLMLCNSQKSSSEIIETNAPLIDPNFMHGNEKIIFGSIINEPRSTEIEIKQTVPAPKGKNVDRIIPKLKAQHIANSKVSYEELYAINFEPCKDETMNLDLRGEDAIESRWNLGFYFLKKNEIVKAKEQFEIVKSLHDPKYNKEVDKLLRQLEPIED